MVKKRRAKKAVVIRGAVPLARPGRHHELQPHSGMLLFWLSMLALLMLNMLAVLLFGLVSFMAGGGRALIIVIGLGLLFGIVTRRLLSMIDPLGPRHHFLAHALVPAAAIATLFAVGTSVNALSASLGLGFRHNPVAAGLAYGLAFVAPAAIAAAFKYCSRLRLPARQP